MFSSFLSQLDATDITKGVLHCKHGVRVEKKSMKDILGCFIVIIFVVENT